MVTKRIRKVSWSFKISSLYFLPFFFLRAFKKCVFLSTDANTSPDTLPRHDSTNQVL